MAESSRDIRPALDRALALSCDAITDQPAGLLTDFDGTLSPIVADPAQARLVEGASSPLEELARRLAVVAIVTGRAPLDARRMIDVPGVLVAGNHGTEWLEPDADFPVPSPEAARVRLLLADALDRVPMLDGVMVEDKGLSATIHVRNASDPGAARAMVLRALGPLAAGLESRPGRMSIELRPVGLGDKGVATRTIIERFALRGAVVLGDDLTDLDMFAAVAEARDAGRLRAAIIGVGGMDADVPPDVAAAADVVVTGVEDAAALLAGLAEALA